MKKDIISTALIIAGVAAALWFGKGTEISDLGKTTQELDSFKIALIEDPADHLEVTPGEDFDYNVRLKNEGTDPAVVFIRITNPVVEGAVLADGTNDPAFINYSIDESAWTKVDDGVYSYNDVLEGGESTKPLFSKTSFPEYDFHAENGKVMTGDLTVENLGDYKISGQGYALMTGIKGTHQELWDGYMKNIKK